MEDLDSVVVAVGHGNDSAGAECDVGGKIKLAGARPPRSEPVVERAVGVEDIGTVAERVGHGNDSAGAECDAEGTAAKVAGA